MDNFSKIIVEMSIICVFFYVVIFSLVKKEFFFRRSNLFFLIFMMSAVFFVKLIVAYYDNETIYYFPVIAEFKPIFFLFFGMVIIETSKKISLKDFADLGCVFSTFVIIDLIIRYALFGELRPGVLSESNYDGFLILICFCAAINVDAYSKLRLLLMVIATLATMSKTGIICLLVIFAIDNIERFKVRKVFIMLLISLPAVYLIGERISNIDNILSIDRFVMWTSFITLFGELSFIDILFGTTPGIPLRLYDDYLSWFVINQSESNGALGLHAFNYHSFYIRYFLSYGLLLLILLICFLIRMSLKNKFLRYITIIVFLQSFSLGTFYLSTVSLPLLIAYRGVHYDRA
ncbi:hypothetical protein [Aliivibrio fischeri]|uniref:hypothetical protein n=1 Tax=Aliivibrio fischeri TaxID=668 RepID=UPI0012DAE668|nr:hypothetical protein [Aliivibrio fischeri]MUL16628.1 hypothetical protein [Aliivibrio fischeri]